MPNNFIEDPDLFVTARDMSIQLTMIVQAYGAEISFSGIDSDVSLAGQPNDIGDAFSGSLIIDYSEYLAP